MSGHLRRPSLAQTPVASHFTYKPKKLSPGYRTCGRPQPAARRPSHHLPGPGAAPLPPAHALPGLLPGSRREAQRPPLPGRRVGGTRTRRRWSSAPCEIRATALGAPHVPSFPSPIPPSHSLLFSSCLEAQVGHQRFLCLEHTRQAHILGHLHLLLSSPRTFLPYIHMARSLTASPGILLKCHLLSETFSGLLKTAISYTPFLIYF